MPANPTPTGSVTAATARERLEGLLRERTAALHSVLGHNTTYMADLDADIAACRAAYVGAAVTELALRRSRLHGRLHG